MSNGGEDVRQGGVGGRCGGAELAQVGATAEPLALTDDDDSTNVVVGGGTGDSGGESGADGVPEAVDGWVGEADDGDAVAYLVPHCR